MNSPLTRLDTDRAHPIACSLRRNLGPLCWPTAFQLLVGRKLNSFFRSVSRESSKLLLLRKFNFGLLWILNLNTITRKRGRQASVQLPTYFGIFRPGPLAINAYVTEEPKDKPLLFNWVHFPYHNGWHPYRTASANYVALSVVMKRKLLYFSTFMAST
jgi:hypothetical protein